MERVIDSLTRVACGDSFALGGERDCGSGGQIFSLPLRIPSLAAVWM